MNNSKTFRLFISSTFNDFREERKILQTKVFPKIKEYCSEKGYRLQPIDLRWGINEEAQLDQKTLELCLEEVKTCKSYPHPNFLVMLGDRYGWIPLPYAIEQNEFEELLKFTNTQEKELLLEWYQLDKNQLPASYILKQREGEYIDFDIWNKVEIYILKILQKSANNSSISAFQKRKYFSSATEAEIVEGIIPYIKPTQYQKILLKSNPNLVNEDPKFIFGFIRNIDIKSKRSEKFITNDYSKAQDLKIRVKSVLIKDNILESNTKQLDKNDLDTNYLTAFEQKIIAFLKEKLDIQITKEKTFTELEIELQEQEYFAKQKRKNFIGQENVLKTINNYIESDNQQIFVLYGKSGTGKSSIIAKAISNVKTKHIVVYRFVGATANSASSKNLLISILKELNIDFKETDLHKNETFVEFSQRIHNKILNIKQDVIIFIDAVDQLIHTDQFLWLPSILPQNIKIIISALDDENYKTDSKYFVSLKEKTDNIIKVDTFNKPKELLLSLLKKEQRSIQKHQFDYFLAQYNQVKTPLYIYVASQEIKHWKSFDLTENDKRIATYKIQSLANSQKGIIKEFIENLSTIFHHDKDFVQKVLSFIYASKDGLSENEILELINTDKPFIKKIAPNTWHKNINKELPLVIWTRLYTQLKPFLSRKNQDNEILLSFFHREFADAIKNNLDLKNEFKNLLQALQILIKTFQNNDFYSNRFGIIYALSLNNYYLYFKIRKNSQLFSFFLKINNFYTEIFTQWILSQWDEYTNVNHSYLYISYHISKLLYSKNNDLWAEAYSFSLNDLAFSLSKINRLNESLELEKEALKIRKKYLLKNNKWKEEYTTSLLNISDTYSSINKINIAIKYAKQALEVTEKSYKKDNEKWIENYNINLTHLSAFYKKNNDIEKALFYSKKAYSVILKQFKKSSKGLEQLYYVSMRDLADLYFSNNELKKSLHLNKNSLAFIEKLYLKNKQKWAKHYVNGLNQIAVTYIELRQISKSILFETKAFTIVENLYNEDNNLWQKEYFRLINNININNSNVNVLEKLFEIKILLKKLYSKHKEIWLELYINTLNNIGFYYLDNGLEASKALKLFEEVHSIIQSAYLLNKDLYVEEYFSSLNNLSSYYLEVNETKRAVKFAEDAFLMIKRLYKNNPTRWSKDYTLFLSNLSYAYTLNGNHKLAIKLELQNNELTEKLYLKDKMIWNNDYIKSLYNLAFLLKEENKIEEALIKEKRALRILTPLHKQDNLSWNEEMLTVLNNIAFTHRLLHNNKQAKKYYSKAIDLLETLYKENSNYWLENYVTSINNYADLLKKPSLKLIYFEKSFKIIEAAYIKTPKFWIKMYASSLRNLGMAYKEIKDIDKAIMYEKKALNIYQNFYSKNADEWIDAYTLTLNNLAYSYHLLNNYNLAYGLEKKSVSILTPYFTEEPDIWLESYTTALNNLAVTCRHLKKMKKALSLQKKSVQILAKYYKQNKERWLEDYKFNLENLQNLLTLYQKINNNKEANIIKKKLKSLIANP